MKDVISLVYHTTFWVAAGINTFLLSSAKTTYFSSKHPTISNWRQPANNSLWLENRTYRFWLLTLSDWQSFGVNFHIINCRCYHPRRPVRSLRTTLSSLPETTPYCTLIMWLSYEHLAILEKSLGAQHTKVSLYPITGLFYDKKPAVHHNSPIQFNKLRNWLNINCKL